MSARRRHSLDRSRLVVRVALGLIAVAAGAPASAEKVTLTGRFPARNAEASQLRRIAFGNFGGSGGARLASALRAELATGEAGGAPWFTVVASTSGRSRRRVGSEAVISGSSEGSISDVPVQRQTYECVERYGKKCTRYATISCTHRIVTASVDVQIARTSDNRIVYSSNKPFHEEMEWCAGQAPAMSVDDVSTQIALAVAREVKKDIAPYTETYVLKVKESTDGLPKSAKDRFKSAIKLSVKDLQGSCAAWEALKPEGASSPALQFDLGLCAEAVGNFAAAAAYYQQSQALVPSGSKDAAEASARVRLLIAARDQASQQQAQRQQTEASDVRAEAEAEKASQRQAAAAVRAQRNAEASARNRAAAQAAAARNERENRRQQVATKYGAGAADAILAGRPVKGMTAAQVQAAIGPPSRRERISNGEEQWYYPGRRIIFSGGRVTYIGS
jgi:hypothetical protein